MPASSRGRGLVAAALALTLLAAGCKTGTPSAAGGTAASGTAAPVPPPAPGAGPDAAALPPAAALPSGSPQAVALALAKQVKQGGSAAEAALRAALPHAGIALTEVDGTVVAKPATPSLGIGIPIGQLMFVADANTYDHGHWMSGIASTFDAIYSDKIDAKKLRGAFLTDLRDQADGGRPSDAPTQTFLSSFIIDVGMQASPVSDIANAADNDVELTGLQTWLLWLSFAGGAYLNAVKAARATHAAAPIAPVRAVLADDGPCSAFNGTVGDAAANAAGAATGGVPFSDWDGVGGLAPPPNPGKSMGLGEWLGLANAALSLVHLLVEGLALKASGGLTPTPLVRTKGIAPAHGAQGTLKLTLRYDLPHGQYANCLRTQLNASGLDFSLPNDGPVKAAEVDWHIIDDAAGITNNPAQFYSLGGGNAVKTTTDDNGTTRTGLEGRPQKSPVPDGVRPLNRDVEILAGIVVKPTEILNTLNDAITAALGGVGAPVILAVNLAERSQFFDVTMHVTVRDWPRDFMVSASVNQDNGNGNYPFLSGVKCDGVAGAWHLDINGAPGLDFTLDASGRGTARGDFGPVNVVLLPGDPAQLQFSLPGAYYQTVTVLPGDFCDH